MKKKKQKRIDKFGGRNPICLNSNSGRNGVVGLQPSLKDRIYDSNSIACTITTSPFFMPLYLITNKEDN